MHDQIDHSRDLARLAAHVASAEATWRHLVRWDSTSRVYTRLVWQPEYEVWLLCWAPGQSVALHDHGDASGAFVVTEGTLCEAYVSRSGRLRRLVYESSAVRRVPPRRIHTVWNPGASGAVSVHAYAPPLSAMTFYGEPRAGEAPQATHAERVNGVPR